MTALGSQPSVATCATCQWHLFTGALVQAAAVDEAYWLSKGFVFVG